MIGTRALALGIAITSAWVASSSAAPASVPHLRRVAIVIGANDPPPGHQALRFAHDDANQMSDVLRRVGQFSDVRVLLDPHPSELLSLMQEVDEQARAAGGDGLVLFYYSGHSDGSRFTSRRACRSTATHRGRSISTAAPSAIDTSPA